MKFYLFYLKYDKSLYAFTTIKEYAEKFLEERNPKCFKMKTVKLKGEKEKIFMYNNKLLLLHDYPFQTGIGPSDYVELMSTAKEDDKLTQEIENMQSTIEEIDRLLKECPLKQEYSTIINRMTSIYDNTGHILIDAFSLFIDIHRDTFIEREPINPNNLSVWDSHSDNVLLSTF